MDVFTTRDKEFALQYQLAGQIGEKRFGSPCPHEKAKDGVCLNCWRPVIDRLRAKRPK